MTTDYKKQPHHEFLSASQEALGKASLQIALSRLTDTLAAGNRSAFSALPDSDLLREKARSIKDHTLASLDTYLEQLSDSVISKGGQVHWAKDAQDVRNIILDIAQKKQVQRIVKSKSMTTEEIHLNDALEHANLEVIETDFGEYILQLAKERPSHLVAPAVHKTREEIADLLESELKIPVTPEPEAMAKLARNQLRKQFQKADMGITGVNFAVAETGTIVLVSNEGNARLTATIPRIHVAVMGIEKVIPALKDLPVFIKLLARAATGQKISVYTSLVTGPRRTEEHVGPQEFHLVIMDNGRTDILGGPMRESLFCIRCGACLNACPIYRNVGGHAYGGTYSGPIGAVLTPLYDNLEDHHHLPHASSLCGSCQAACPVKIAIPELLVRLRASLNHQKLTPFVERLIYQTWAHTMVRPGLYRLASSFAGWLMRLGASGNWLTKMPGPIKGWTQTRDFRTPPKQSFRNWWKKQKNIPF